MEDKKPKELLPALNIADLLTSKQSVAGLEGVLQQIEKYSSAMERVEKFMDRIERLKIIQPLIAIYAKKNGVELPEDKGIEPKSETHRTLYASLNTLSEEQIVKLADVIKGGLEGEKRHTD